MVWWISPLPWNLEVGYLILCSTNPADKALNREPVFIWLYLLKGHKTCNIRYKKKTTTKRKQCVEKVYQSLCHYEVYYITQVEVSAYFIGVWSLMTRISASIFSAWEMPLFLDLLLIQSSIDAAYGQAKAFIELWMFRLIRTSPRHLQ